MGEIYASIACNLDKDILAAALPLFNESRIEGLEWSFDALYQQPDIPEWFDELLQFYSSEERLIGHGVFFSIFSGKWTPNHQAWLDHLEHTASKYRFDHVTEHFGFMTGKDFHQGAPLNIPYTNSTLKIGRDRLKRIYNACKCPVGLENLAFSYSLEETKRHGQFLNELVEEINGFIILDLHNLYCQVHNFRLDFDDIIKLYPLDRVREIHISGGSWEASAIEPSLKIRRDTHDDAVPEEVFQYLSQAIQRCPNLKFVVLEQLGTALHSETSRKRFGDDFLRMKALISSTNSAHINSNKFLPVYPLSINEIVEDPELHLQQRELSSILESSLSFEEVHNKLANSSLANTSWNVEQWEPYMLETAMQIARKWM